MTGFARRGIQNNHYRLSAIVYDLEDMTESGDGDERALSLLADCVEDPAAGKRRLPAVLGLLEADDDVTRLAAAWTCCLVATTHPDTAEYVVERLGDRLGEGEVSLELTHALDYLADRHPDLVEAALADADATEGDRPPEVWFPTTGFVTRNHYYGREPRRPGVGRVRLPGAEGREDPRTTYTRGRPDEHEIAANRAELAAADESSDGNADAPDERDEGDRAAAESGPAGDAATEGDDPGTFVRPTTDVSAIAARSRFDQLHILAAQARSRYSEDFRALVGRGGEERAITLRLLDVPDGADVRADFVADADEALGRWDAVGDHPHVLTLLDRDLDPRPWLATTVAGESLAGQGRLDPDQALSDAIALADAVGYVHRNDVVHAGIDPGNVAYPGDVLDGNDQEPPLLNNVGLVEYYRRYENPATLLDPRYAAPEYFDRRFGVVDAATDVYGLGAVIYHLFAGRPPFAGSFGEVRDAVTSPATPVPGDVVADVPAGIDEVVTKATATRKLTRYETVEHLQQDLYAVREAQAE